MLYLWIKALSYRQRRVLVCRAVLPATPVRLSRTKRGHISKERFSVMERKLYRGIMGPAMIAT
jgi:uncharacterized membrane protein